MVELLSMIGARETASFIVKGGSSLQMRLGIREARATKDLDALVAGDLRAFIEQVPSALATGWSGFSGVMTTPAEFQTEGMHAPGYRFAVKVAYRNGAICSVPVEITSMGARSAGYMEAVLPANLTDVFGQDHFAAVPCMGLCEVIATKLHACTEPTPAPGNTRAHDLVDLQCVVPMLDDSARRQTAQECRAVFAERATHTWPPVITGSPDWPTLYAKAAEDLDVLPTVDQAIALLAAFIAELNVLS